MTNLHLEHLAKTDEGADWGCDRFKATIRYTVSGHIYHYRVVRELSGGYQARREYVSQDHETLDKALNAWRLLMASETSERVIRGLAVTRHVTPVKS